MKKLLFTLITCCMGALSAAAQENVTIDGINYYLYNDEATIMVQPETLSGNIIIPATVSHNGKEYEVVRIADNAFERTDITSIELPEGITALSNNCFSSCENLTAITLKGNITDIGEYCFTYCRKLSSLDFLPKTVNSLSANCFMGCDGLTNIHLPNNITSLGKECFYQCKNITDVILPNGITTIPDNCFAGSGLRSISLHENIKTLGNTCFNACKNLTSISLPKSIIKMGTYNVTGLGCFSNCINLQEVICQWDNLDNLSISGFIFDGIFSEAILRVPKGTADMYRQTSPWSQFKYIEEMDEEAEDAEQCATPTIAFEGKKLTFSSVTDGAEYHYTIADNDVKTEAYSKDGVVELDAAYEVKVYASASGYKNSDMAYATIFFIDQAETATGLTFAPEQRGVMVTNDGQTVTVSGLEDGERVELYAVDGTLLDTGAAVAAGTVSLDAGQATGVVIVKAGQSSMKVSLR